MLALKQSENRVLRVDDGIDPRLVNSRVRWISLVHRPDSPPEWIGPMAILSIEWATYLGFLFDSNIIDSARKCGILLEAVQVLMDLNQKAYVSSDGRWFMDAMAEAAVKFALEQLSVLIREEYSLLGGIRDDAEEVMNAFHRFSAVLRVADEREEIDPQVRAWVKIIRELVYDTEDVLDEFQFRFGGGGRIAGGFFSKIQSIYTCAMNLRARRRLALQLRRVKAKLNKISQEQPRLLTPSDPTIHNHNKREYDPRRDALLLKHSDLVGIDNPKLFLVNLLLAVDEDLRVHSVVGMGGLGKTTLVKKVFDDARVVNHFQPRVWLTISETFDVDELLKDAIRQIIKQTNQQLPQDFVAMNTDKLKEFINDILSGQTYIIVLDDIWAVSAWMAFRYVFPGQSFCSRILITTRNNEIGVHASNETHGHVYSLEPLSPKDSWILFCKKTFLDGSCPPHLVRIAENILKKCDGLPLAVVVIAGVLATKNESIEEWEKFQSSLNIQMESNDWMKNIKNLLSLSYYDLPYYLKYCFLYLSIFPEDVIIEKMRVIRLWIAEGFVRENNQQVKEEVAEAYLNELLHRNLIILAEKAVDGRMKGFRVHDILREVILSKSVEQNFTIIIPTRQNTELSNKSRRLAIHRFDDRILGYTSSKMHLRSLQFFEPLSSSALSSLSKMFTAKYIPLKVLDLRGAELEEISEEVFNLFQLKYLSLRRTKLRSVSKSIGRLQNLETLDLKHTYVVELPAELLKLCKLRHLLVYRYQDRWSNPWIITQSFNAPFKIGGLVCLQKLCWIQANDTLGIKIVSEIGKLTQLRRLGVQKLRQEDGKEFCLSLEKLTNICSLSLTSTSEDEVLDIQYPLHVIPLGLQRLYLTGRLERVPQWLSLLVGLTRLRLHGNRLVEDPLPFFQDLPMLTDLDLSKSYEGEGLCFKAKKFSKLKCLHICDCAALKWIRIEEGALHHLEEFYLLKCKLLEQMPLGIHHLSNLKSFSIHDMGDKLMASLEQNGEDYAKISHIPKITISQIIDVSCPICSNLLIWLNPSGQPLLVVDSEETSPRRRSLEALYLETEKSLASSYLKEKVKQEATLELQPVGLYLKIDRWTAAAKVVQSRRRIHFHYLPKHCRCCIIHSYAPIAIILLLHKVCQKSRAVNGFCKE
nr:disease resistance protein RPM1-like [Ipomoea batatas]